MLCLRKNKSTVRAEERGVVLKDVEEAMQAIKKDNHCFNCRQYEKIKRRRKMFLIVLSGDKTKKCN